MDRHQRGHVHQALRQATAQAHRALDHQPLIRRLTGRELTREQYAESLAAMHRPHSRLERLVHESRHCPESGLELLPRLALLEADLSQLSWPAPDCVNNPPDSSDTYAAWWGRVYVLEGSRMGSAVLARCIHASLGDAVPCRFFSEAARADVPGTLLSRLERELNDPEELTQAVASARAAFAAFKSGLDSFDREKYHIQIR